MSDLGSEEIEEEAENDLGVSGEWGWDGGEIDQEKGLAINDNGVQEY